MKYKSILMVMLISLAFSFVYAQDTQHKQEIPPGMHPRPQADSAVVDDDEKTPGAIENGKVCDATGKAIGTLSATGDVTPASGKSIEKIQKDRCCRSMKGQNGQAVTTDPEGVVKAAGKKVAKVEASKAKSHGCAHHCFCNAENKDAEETDKNKKDPE